MATRARTLASETDTLMILWPGSKNFRARVGVRVVVRLPFKLLIRSKMTVGGRNVETA